MNTIAKVSVASALALGFGVAHASILDPQSGGDVLLFAEVLSGTTVVGSYAGDSGIAIGAALSSGTVGTLSTSTDAALSSLLTVAASAGNTIEWAVEGGKLGGGQTAGVWSSSDQYVTTIGPQGPAQLALKNGVNATNWSTGITTTINEIDTNSGGANSVFATSLAAGGLFDTSSASNIANWYGNGTATANTGVGTSTTLYHVAMGTTQTAFVALASLGTVTLTATGLTFAPTAVPLPAAIWLLGGGLLGLAGVGRRKSVAAA
jgi:hypothetical protein